MVLLLGAAFAADMAWECRSFTTALEAVEYRDASVDGGLTDAYDTLYALIDANCVVTSCDPDCEEIVDCVTEAGDLINWLSETTNEADILRTWERIEVIPAASSGYGWTRAQADYETGYMSISYWVAWANRSFEYDGDWADGWPTDGVIGWRTYDYDAVSEVQSWDDGTCVWSSTGNAASSMALQIGSNIGSVRCWPETLASTITPQAPAFLARSSSLSAVSGYCQGSEQKNWMRSGQVFLALAIASFMMRAALRLTSSPPQ